MATRVHLCGRLQVEWDGKRLEEELVGNQSRLVFAYLALHRDRPVRRDELVEALWGSDAAPVNGDALLRPVLSRLRRALGPDRVEGRAHLAVGFPADTWIDWEAAVTGLRKARESAAAGDHAAAYEASRAAVEIADRGLLPGLEGDWLERFRSELDEVRAQALEVIALAGAHLGPAELAEAEQAARRAVELSPYRESARAALIEVLRRRGNLAEALVAYDEIRALLRDELGSLPGPELRALHSALLASDVGDVPAEPAQRILPERLAQAGAAAWVQRGDALERLRAAADQAAAGETVVAFVTGDGGIGKTRLIAELADGLPDFDVLYGRCDEEQLFPYGPWVELLRARLSRLPDAERMELAGPVAGDLSRVLPDLFPEASPAGGLDPETERRQLFVAVTRVIARLAERRPVLAVIDDLHWADRSSLLLGRHLAAEVALGRVLMLCTFRDTELHAGHALPELIADLERHREVPRIRLTGMNDGEVEALIGSVHAAGVAAGTARAIRAETDGNPFFVKQLVRHLEEAGDGGLERFDGLVVPQSVRDVIARRVSRLPPEAGPVLRVAALIGRDFDLDLLAAVAEIDEDALLDVLDAGLAGGLLVESPVTPGRYTFAHALVRTTLEAELSRTRRARLHQRIGLALAQRSPDALDELARHFREAGPAEAATAVDYAVRAAERASAGLAHDEAARLIEGAVALAEPDQRGRLELMLATAEADAGRLAEARASYQRAAAGARETDRPELFAQAALGHAGSHWEHYGRDDPDGIRLLEEALERIGESDSVLRAQVLARLAVSRYNREGVGVAPLAEEALAIARRVDDPAALVAALGAGLYASWGPVRAPTRLAYAEELLTVTEHLGMQHAQADAHLWQAITLMEVCRIDAADEHLDRLVEIADQTQGYVTTMLSAGAQATRAMIAGDFARVEAIATEVEGRARRNAARGLTPPSIIEGMLISLLFPIRGEQGRLGELVPRIDALVLDWSGLPGWLVMRAWGWLQAGERGRAAAEFARLSADEWAVLPRDADFVPALALVAHAMTELDDPALAATVEPLMAPSAGTWVVFGIGTAALGPVDYSLGVLQLAQGRPEAVATLERALELAESMRCRPYVARARAALSRATGDAELAAAALATARELGMTRLERELS